MNIDIVFQSGDILGIGYVGVLKALEENNYKILISLNQMNL